MFDLHNRVWRFKFETPVDPHETSDTDTYFEPPRNSAGPVPSVQVRGRKVEEKEGIES
jgi:hypothetical protein